MTALTLVAAAAAGAARAAPPLLRTAAPSLRTVERTLEVPGSLRPWQEMDLFARVSGYVRSLDVDRGSRVAPGARLVTLEAPELAADAVAAKARAAEAVAEVAQRRAEAGLASVTYDRLRTVRRGMPDAVSVQTVDEARAKADVARRLVEVARARQATAEALASRAEVMAGMAVLRAPFAGVVTERWVDPRAFVPAAGSARGEGARLLHLADTSRLRLLLSVPETESRHVRPGTLARVSVDAVPGQVRNVKLARVSEALQPSSRTLAAEADLDNPDQSLPAGAFARVTLVLEVHERATVVPREAVVSVAKKPHLAIIEDGKLRRRPVKLGPDVDGLVEVLGLVQGDSLVPLVPGTLLGLGVSDSTPDGEAVRVETPIAFAPK
ncbi:MAG: efflux RND transporter periplasmic adaptor subunit [Candidatus Wallbacteria bacterium]|nr:efflux RND transporter periplasmic adaptor subunit [Candidatus Wallbacteria bacterium]